jgi:hypothetical protein
MNARRAITITCSTAALIAGAMLRDVVPALAEGFMLLALGGVIVMGGWIAVTAWGGRG